MNGQEEWEMQLQWEAKITRIKSLWNIEESTIRGGIVIDQTIGSPPVELLYWRSHTSLQR